MSKNPLTAILEANIFNGTNYNDWLRNLRIVLDFENQIYVLDRSLPRALAEESTHEERLTFEKWLEDNRKIYAVPDRHIRYAATKVFFGTKMIEGSSVQQHEVKMLSLVEKLKDLKANLEKETYNDVILQSLPPFFDSFIVNYNMNRLDKDLHELINMLVQYETTIEKFAPSVFGRKLRPQKQKAKGLDAGGGRRVRQNQLLQALRALLLPRWAWANERGRRFDSHGFQKMFALIVVKRGIGRGSVLNSSLIKVVYKSRRLRQTVLKLCNGRVVAAMVVGLSRLS
ncbi:UNVERIFIED_CONTAM: hypothetical protein Sradi_1539200 [Sesamum radiatum]|uniref:Gag-pol polyprotein n=1 Tax=Sesamum radiatum TaxID=300843 RepID=A0AAW2U8Y4_SESRA